MFCGQPTVRSHTVGSPTKASDGVGQLQHLEAPVRGQPPHSEANQHRNLKKCDVGHLVGSLEFTRKHDWFVWHRTVLTVQILLQITTDFRQASSRPGLGRAEGRAEGRVEGRVFSATGRPSRVLGPGRYEGTLTRTASTYSCGWGWCGIAGLGRRLSRGLRSRRPGRGLLRGCGVAGGAGGSWCRLFRGLRSRRCQALPRTRYEPGRSP
jgi:hypothetical protein